MPRKKPLPPPPAQVPHLDFVAKPMRYLEKQKEEKPIIFKLAMYATAITTLSIFVSGAWAKFDPYLQSDSPPLASKDSVTELKHTVWKLSHEIIEAQNVEDLRFNAANSQNKEALILQLPLWQEERAKAAIQMRQHPNDPLYRQQYDAANQTVHTLEVQLGLPPS